MNTSTKASNSKRESFPVLEMSCAACAVSVESILRSTKGVVDASVNFANQTALVNYNPAEASPADLQNAVRSIGYDLVVNVEDPQAIQREAQEKHYQQTKAKTIWSSVLAVPVVIIGMFFMDAPYATYASMVLSAPVVFYFGRSFFINAFKQAQHGTANMDTLVALSTGIAFAFSTFNTFYPAFWHSRGLHAHVYYEAAAVVVAFILLGKLLEEKAKSNTSSAIKKLMGLQPKEVTVVIDGQEQKMSINQVAIGQHIVVKPGERIAVDGLVKSGSSYVDESTITGEPIPVLKSEDAKVFAGTINQKGSFEFEATKVGGETVLAQIIKMVQQAQGSKAPVQKLVDRIAGIFVPVVMTISVLTFLLWIILGGENAFTHGLLTSITVLVIACPCALGLATPTAIMVGIGKGAEHNILIKDAESLELAHRVNALVLDKTGTITEGKPVVSEIRWESDAVKKSSVDILLSIESRSEHPLAEAITAHLKADASLVSLTEFQSITARGAKAKFSGTAYFTGNQRLMEENNIMFTEHLKEQALRLQSQANTVVLFSNSERVLAVIAITDKIKSTSKEAIAALKRDGIEIYMLTGDNLQTAQAVASQLGISNFKAEVLPSDKASFIKDLQQQGKIVAMAGDGINDSHALAQADVSIAMGKGSDIAMDVAKMTLITSDLRAISKAFRLSTKTVRTIRQNLFWAFIYNLIGIPLAAGILYPVNGFLLDPMIAGGAMALSSLSVVTNALRLKASKLV